MQEVAEQPVIPDQPEADQNIFIPNETPGSNPSSEPDSNPSHRAEETVEELRSKIHETQAANEAFRAESVALNQRIIRITRENQEYRQQQLDLITKLQDEIQELKTRVTEQPKGKEGLSRKEEPFAYFVTKFAENFPRFDAQRSETELRAWEDYWEEVEAFKRITNCSDMVLAYLIKDSAVDGSPLSICLKDVSHVAGDGYIDIHDLKLEGIKARMLEDFGPKRNNMADQARKRYENTRRKFKERPKWFFGRLEMNELNCRKRIQITKSVPAIRQT